MTKTIALGATSIVQFNTKELEHHHNNNNTTQQLQQINTTFKKGNKVNKKKFYQVELKTVTLKFQVFKILNTVRISSWTQVLQNLLSKDLVNFDLTCLNQTSPDMTCPYLAYPDLTFINYT